MLLFRQVGFKNRGAELMLRAMKDSVTQYEWGTPVAIDVTSISGSFAERASLGLLSMPKLWRLGFQFGRFADFLPKRICLAYGIARPKDILEVWDAAGFAYTDKWGESLSAELLDAVKYYKKRGARFIFLPQAFGPFKNPKIAHNVCRALELSDLVFIRDDISYEHIRSLNLDDFNDEKYIRSCDFTANLLCDNSFDDTRAHGMVGLVPNLRIVDKLGIEAESYIRELRLIQSDIEDEGYEVVLIIHEKDDEKIVDEFPDTKVFRGNAIELKQYIGGCEFLISSRYHACVSALSQGVPVLTIGWSHKYEELHKEWCVPDLLVPSIDLTKSSLTNLLQNLNPVKEAIKASRPLIESQIVSMWSRVHRR